MIKSTYAPSTIARLQARNEDLGRIHEAKAQLGLTERAYRKAIFTASKETTRTSAELDSRGRQRAIKAFVQLGYAPTESKASVAVDREERRKRELQAIHAGKRGLGLAENLYRDLIECASNGKTRSSADLNARERASVMKSMAGQGFQFDMSA